jgi:DNA-directed RNA polymerase subunit omega
MDYVFLPVESEFISTQSRYRFAILAAQRARQIMEGDKPTVKPRHVKPTTIAMEDIAHGDLNIYHGKEAVRYQEEAARARKDRRSRYLSPEREEEIKKEIKKDLSVYISETEQERPTEEAPDTEPVETDES